MNKEFRIRYEIYVNGGLSFSSYSAERVITRYIYEKKNYPKLKIELKEVVE